MIKHGAKLATHVVETLKTSPGMLTLVLLQAATLAMVYFSVQGNQERMQVRELALIERCFAQKGAQS